MVDVKIADLSLAVARMNSQIVVGESEKRKAEAKAEDDKAAKFSERLAKCEMYRTEILLTIDALFKCTTAQLLWKFNFKFNEDQIFLLEELLRQEEKRRSSWWVPNACRSDVIYQWLFCCCIPQCIEFQHQTDRRIIIINHLLKNNDTPENHKWTRYQPIKQSLCCSNDALH